LGYSWLGLGREIGESRMGFWWSWVGPRGGAPACVKGKWPGHHMHGRGLFLEGKKEERREKTYDAWW
jgi:hypothetical protein